ncbi:MAG: polymerase delta prime subunit [Rhodospirillales bacterium]|nr:polymerase delta prime subunit [Rhodospirillales bacterium]
MSDEDIDFDEEADAAAAPAEVPEPRDNPFLTGHDEAESRLLESFTAGKLPHAIILGGPRGIGKATLAFRLARFLLSQPATSPGPDLFGAPPAPPASLTLSPEAPVFKRIAAGGHADLMTVERGIDPKRKDRLRSEIVVDDTRDVAGFLRLTSAEGGWRIVIVDSADEMNRNAANALLKILEEPPRNSLLMLISHNPGRLLATIRSRCRKLVLKPLSEETVVDLLGRYRPEIAGDEARALARLAEGSIGRAIALADAGGIDLYRGLLKLLGRLPDLDAPTLHAFADTLARADADESYRTVIELLTQFLSRMIRRAVAGNASDGAAEIVAGEHQAMQHLAERRGLDQWVEVWEKIARSFAQADGLNLDRKQVVLGAFLALEGASR